MNKPTQECKHCGGDIAIRNPKGFCDHLHYPENCDVCSHPSQPEVVNSQKEVVNKVVKSQTPIKSGQTSEGSWIKEFKKISDIFYGFHEVVDDHTKKECDCFPLLVSKLERFISKTLARERRDVVERIKKAKPHFCKECMPKDRLGVAQTAVDTYEIQILDDLTREESR